MEAIRRGTGKHAFLAEVEQRLEATCREWTDQLAFDGTPNRALKGFMDVLLEVGCKHFSKPPDPCTGYDAIRGERLELLARRREMRVKLAGASTLGEAARIQARLKAITRQAAVLRRKAARRDKQQCLE